MQRSLLGQVMTSRPCPTCRGVGEVIPDPCHRCGGDGRVRSRREISVKIPAGVADGMRVRLAAQGEVGPGGGPAGDLYVEVHEQSHDIFRREGDDLHCTVEVPMVDAALGTSVTVDAILDGPTEITVPAGTQPGAVVTLRGHGMPHLRSGVRGNLHAHIDVVVPTKLDHKDIELLREVKKRRSRDVAEVRSAHPSTTHSGDGGIFSRLRETFSGHEAGEHAPDISCPIRCSTSMRVPQVGGIAVVDGDEGFHAATVRRIRAGERFVVGDGAGAMADCIVERSGKRELSARVLTRRTVDPPTAAHHGRAGTSQGRPIRTGDRTGHRGGRRSLRCLARRTLCRPLGRCPRGQAACVVGGRWPGPRRASHVGRSFPASTG